MKNKKTIIALIALVAVIGLMAGIWYATRQTPEDPDPETTGSTEAKPSETGSVSTEPTFAKTFTLIVIHSDGGEKSFTIGTNQTYLADALLDEQLIVESDSPGMYTVVDGETADYNVDQSYWGFFVGEDYAMEGMNTTVIQDGAVYKLVYTK